MEYLQQLRESLQNTNKPACKDQGIVIILTSTVHTKPRMGSTLQTDPADRLLTYYKSIMQWLYKTSFRIVLVENSGYSFTELDHEKTLFKERFEVISFLPDAEYLKAIFNKGAHEMYAINYAFNHSKLIAPSAFIIKVTARYFIPAFEEYLSQHDITQYECLTQHHRRRCEIVGCRYDKFGLIFKEGTDGHCAERIWYERTSACSKILVCKPFNIEATQRGVGTYFNKL